MSTTTHTPAPWAAADHGVFATELNDHGNFYVAALPFPSEEVTEKDKANLALIAAAPDLLAALLDSELVIDSAHRHSNGTCTAFIVTLEKIRAAITKATNPNA